MWIPPIISTAIDWRLVVVETTSPIITVLVSLVIIPAPSDVNEELLIVKCPSSEERKAYCCPKTEDEIIW